MKYTTAPQKGSDSSKPHAHPFAKEEELVSKAGPPLPSSYVIYLYLV